MKLTIKLNKEEAEGFKNWTEAVKPPEVQEDQFLKTIFFNGIEYLNQQLAKIAQEVMASEAAKSETQEGATDDNSDTQ